MLLGTPQCRVSSLGPTGKNSFCRGEVKGCLGSVAEKPGREPGERADRSFDIRRRLVVGVLLESPSSEGAERFFDDLVVGVVFLWEGFFFGVGVVILERGDFLEVTGVFFFLEDLTEVGVVLRVPFLDTVEGALD